MKSEFKKTGLTNLTATVKRFSTPQQLLDNIMVRLCQIGVTAISEAYSDTHGTGASMAGVYYKKVNNQWQIIAESDGLLYLEFGAGITQNPDGANIARGSLEYIDTNGVQIADIGTYGLGQGSLYSWYAPPLGRKTTGTRSRHGFANAITAIHANVDTIIKEELAKL